MICVYYIFIQGHSTVDTSNNTPQSDIGGFLRPSISGFDAVPVWCPMLGMSHFLLRADNYIPPRKELHSSLGQNIPQKILAKV